MHSDELIASNWGEDATLADGGSYQIVTRDHLLEMQNILRKSWLSTLSKLETNAVLYDEIDGSGGPSTSSSAGYFRPYRMRRTQKRLIQIILTLIQLR